MAAIISKTVNGYGPYLYKVTHLGGGEQNWEFLGKAGAVDEDPGPIPDDYQPETEHAVNGVTRSRVDDPAAAALLDELDEEDAAGTYEDLVDALAVEGGRGYDEGDMRSLLNLMDTDDEELADAIDTIQNERKSNSLGTRTRTTKRIPASEEEVRDALDTIEEKIGVRPGEIAPGSSSGTTLTNTDIQMPTDADAAADLLNGVIQPLSNTLYEQDAEWQEGIQNALEDTVGTDAVRRAKQEVSDPDSLGFAHPDEIPTNASDSGKTPLTDLYGVGPATATENHPDGDEIALEDFGTLSELQRKRFAAPMDITENTEAFRDTVARVADRSSDPTAAVIGGLQMTESGIDELYGSDQKDVVSVGPSGEDWGTMSQDKMSRVTTVERRDDEVYVVTEAGGESRLSQKYWDLIDPVVPDDATMRSGVSDEYPVEIELGNGDSVVVAPRED